MPRIPTTRSSQPGSNSRRVPTKDVADRLFNVMSIINHAKSELLDVKSTLDHARDDLSKIHEILYTKGLTELGPLVEDKDDIPF
jgi:hypothetical protein